MSFTDVSLPVFDPFSPLPPPPILQAHRHPGDRVLTRSTALRSATRTAFGPLPPPCAGRGPASVTPGVRKTSRRSCRPRIDPLSVGRCAPASEGFCSSRSPYDCGGTSPAKDYLIGFAFGEIAIFPPDPRRGHLPLPFRPLPLAGKGKRGVAAGEDGTTARRLPAAGPRFSVTDVADCQKNPWHFFPSATRSPMASAAEKKPLEKETYMRYPELTAWQNTARRQQQRNYTGVSIWQRKQRTGQPRPQTKSRQRNLSTRSRLSRHKRPTPPGNHPHPHRRSQRKNRFTPLTPARC
jgi:hypothetical protein